MTPLHYPSPEHAHRAWPHTPGHARQEPLQSFLRPPRTAAAHILLARISDPRLPPQAPTQAGSTILYRGLHAAPTYNRTIPKYSHASHPTLSSLAAQSSIPWSAIDSPAEPSPKTRLIPPRGHSYRPVDIPPPDPLCRCLAPALWMETYLLTLRETPPFATRSDPAIRASRSAFSKLALDLANLAHAWPIRHPMTAFPAHPHHRFRSLQA